MSELTHAQRQAVAQTGNVLVVASAGTGKTSTLVWRCLERVQSHQCSLDEILMVTFTEAAAAEMRTRIGLQLGRMLGQPLPAAQASWLRQQLALLELAPICTLHSFCLQLLRRHFHQLSLDPALSVLDERQTIPLIEEVLDAVLARHYESSTRQPDPVQHLIAEWAGGSEDELRRFVLKVHRYCRSLADAQGWLDQQQAIYAEPQPRHWQRQFESLFAPWHATWLAELQAKPDPKTAVICGLLQKVRAGYTTTDFVRDGQLWRKAISTIPRAKPYKALAEEIGFLCSALLPDHHPNPLAQDWEWARQDMLGLLQLVCEFDQAFARAKADMGAVDFADLEQFALQLLRDRSGQPTATARQWQQRLKFIFVDEYQDINEAQNAILLALSRPEAEGNRFLVGDVKQSIYRFRLANPSIFSGCEQEFRSRPTAGTRIALAENFRSREQILRFVNELFAVLMRPALGGLAYEPDVYLAPGNPEQGAGSPIGTASPAESACEVELHLLDAVAPKPEEDDYSELGEMAAIEREARLVAVLLRELHDTKPAVRDPRDNQLRPVTYGDMVVLLRSPAGRAEAFARQFAQAGVPLVAARSGFFEALEVADLLNLLKILDNPLQDYPVLAVLRSPLVGLSLEDLAEVRATNPEKPFWAAVQKFAGTLGASAGSSAGQKLIAFLDRFERWRLLARQGSLGQCLDTILEETHYEALVLAQGGEECAANVRRFLKLAREHDPLQRQGLYRFLRFVQAQQESQTEEEPAGAQSGDAVRLLSIHKSKGLEFPVVVVAGLGVQFNLQDLSAKLLLHQTWGLCPKLKSPAADQAYPSIAHRLARQSEHRELLGEELRLLYVALTRARDKLILTGSAKQISWRDESAREVSDLDILSARSPWPWIKGWLQMKTKSADWADDSRGKTGLFRWTIHPLNSPRLQPQPAAGSAGRLGPESLRNSPAQSLQTIQTRLSWRYPFAAAAAATALKRGSDLWPPELAKPFTQRRSLAPGFRPNNLDEPADLAAAEIGDAHHRFLESLDLARAGSLDQLRAQAREMLESGLLAQEDCNALDLKGILAFWTSPLGEKIRTQHPASVQREMPFTARVTPEDLAALDCCPHPQELAGEFFIGRGQIDLAVFTPKEIWIVDYKTDRLKAAELKDKVRLYGPQLRFYALAASRIFHRPVTGSWLYFVSLRKLIPIQHSR